MVVKRLWWLRIFVSGVETVMGWRQFVALGKMRGEAWRAEVIRLRQALSNRSSLGPSLRYVPAQTESDVEEGSEHIEHAMEEEAEEC